MDPIFYYCETKSNKVKFLVSWSEKRQHPPPSSTQRILFPLQLSNVQEIFGRVGRITHGKSDSLQSSLTFMHLMWYKRTSTGKKRRFLFGGV